MPSPLPGMDPYLEGHLWTSFHALLAAEIVKQLTPRLRPKYIALPERKYIAGQLEDVLISTGSVIPDVAVRQIASRAQREAATQVLEAPVRMRTALTTAVPHFRILIRDVHKRRLVTAIELLSPSNKHGPGRKQYLRRRQR